MSQLYNESQGIRGMKLSHCLWWILLLLCSMVLLLFWETKYQEGMEMDTFIDYYVIHMRSNEQRMKNILSQEHTLGHTIHVFDAVVGKNVDVNHLNEFDPQLRNNMNYKYVNELGCYLSHFMLVKSLVDNHIDQGYTVIFEDDFLIKQPNLHDHIVQSIQDLKHGNEHMDMLFLGNCSSHQGKLYKKDIYYANKTMDLMCTHAYVINNQSAVKLYQLLLDMDTVIDNKYSVLKNGTLDVFLITPTVVDQQLQDISSTIR